MWSALSLWIAATGLREEMYTECSSETLPNLPGATGPVCYDTVAVGQNTWRNEDPLISPASLKHLGTLDSILQITNLKYVKENHGIGGWDLRLEELELRNQPDEQRGQGTASACYEGSHYLCPPGPCTVLDINYLADVNYYKPGHKNNRGQELVAGRSYCGAAFGVQMQFLNDYTSPDGLLSVRKGTVYPPKNKSRRTLAYLRGNAPDKVQSYIPQNDQVNRIPAWWYKTYEDWQTNGDMRTNGLRCSDRAVPRWMVPSPGISGGEDPDTFEDVENKWYGNYAGAKDRKIDASFHKTVLRASKKDDTPPDPKMHEEPCEQKFGSHRETKFHDHSALPFMNGCATTPTTRSEHPRSARPNEPYPGSWYGSGAGAFTLCDSNVLAGVFLGISTRHHRDLQKGRRLSSLFDGDTSKNAHGIYKALKYYLESATSCRLEAGCDLMSLIRADLNSSTSEEKTRARHALFLGQIATVLRPCESPHTKHAKVKGATYNHWRKAHYNPGQNRAAVERIVLGCDPDNPWMRDHCAAVRGSHQWTASSSCVGQGKCTARGDTCCNAAHEPVVDVDTSKPDDLRAHHFTSYYCTDVGINSDDLDSSMWFELFHTTTKEGARNAWKKKKAKGRTGKAGQDLIQHESKCGMIMSFDPKLKAFVSSDPKFNNSKFYVRNRQERKDDKKLFKGGTKAILVKGAAFMYGAPAIGLGLLGRFVTNKKESISKLVGATFGYGDTKAVTYAGDLESTCNAQALSRFFTILSSCVAYAVPYLRKEDSTLTLTNIKSQLGGGGRKNTSPVCAILGVAIGDCTSNECQCTERVGTYGGETTKVPKYNCEPDTSAYAICKAYDEATHPDNPTETQSGVTWNTALDRALAGPRKRYMLPANVDNITQPLDPSIYELTEFASDSKRANSLFQEFWYGSGEDSASQQNVKEIHIRGSEDGPGVTRQFKKRNAEGNLVPTGGGDRKRHKLRTMQMRPLARFPERSFLPGRITAFGRAKVEGAGSAEGELSLVPNRCTKKHEFIESCSGAGADAFYVFPSTASDNATSPAVGPNARGQLCTARFRIVDFLAINAYVSNYNTGPTDTTRMFPPIDWHLGDKFENLGESCFGSMQSTKQTDYCGWDEANVRAIFNIDTLPTFHHHDTFNLFASTQRSTSRDTNMDQPVHHFPGYMQFLGKPWTEINETDDDWRDLPPYDESTNKPIPSRMAPNNNGLFDMTGYIDACVGEHASAAEISWYNMPTTHSTLTSAVYACEALRMQGCVGVQRFAVDHYEVRSRGQAEQLTHIGSKGACDRFYLVPCLGVETCNDLFGCREDSGVRRNAGRDEPSFLGPNPGEPPVKYDVGADESYFLDGLSMYTANTRFSLNPLAFEGGRSDLEPNDLAEGSEALKYDFNYSHWVFSQEINPLTYHELDGKSGEEKLRTFKAVPKKVPMVTTPGHGLGLPHTNGIRHVPKREGREQSKLFAFSWGGMFDAQEYVHGNGGYRFRHPSADPPEKHPGMFPMVGDGLNISFTFENAEWNFLLDDSFVRAMTSQILDVRTEEGFNEWKELFWKNQRCPMTPNEDGFVEENTDETWGGLWYNIMKDSAEPYSGQNCRYMGGSVTLGGYIDPNNKVGTTTEELLFEEFKDLNVNMSFSDLFSSHFETAPTGVVDPADNFDEFTEAYEGICDLHACDIIQDHQDDVMRADNMMFSPDFSPFRGKDKKPEDLFYRQRNGVGHQYASHVRRAFSCIDTNLTEFHRGRSLVDLQNDGDTWNTTLESYARSAFGLLGFKAVAIERAVLSGMIRAVANRYFQISKFEKKAQWEKILPELESVCTDFLSESGFDMGVRSCNIRAKSWEQVLPGEMDLDGIPILRLLSESTPHFRPGVNAAGFGLGNLQYGKKFASIELQKMRSLPGSAFYDTRRSLDYNGIDTHKLYDEHRDAIPVRDISRSATFTNRQDEAEATPCDCDNQEIVWACERIGGGEDTRLVTFVRPDFGAGPKPTGVFADRFGPDFGDSAAIFECGYSWKQPPMRTPKIGLYVPSKVDILEIYERDIFDGGVVPDFECDPSAVENITDYEDCGQEELQRLHTAERHNGNPCPEGDEDDLECTFYETKIGGKVISAASVNTSDLINCSRSHSGVECTRQTASSQSARQCAADIFSTPMGPHPPKLREMLFTGLHPHPRARYDVNEINSYGRGRVGDAGLNEDEETLIKSGGKAACYTRQNLYVYAGACLRWPFGASHLHTIGHGQHDETTAYWLNRITASQCESPPCPGTANFTKNSKRYTDATDMTGDIAWQGYCELEHERHQFNPEDYSLYDDGRSGKYRYCANDPLSYRQRETLCSTMAPHFVMYAWGLTIRKPTDVCNSVTKVCLLVPGYPGSGSLSRMLDDPDVGPFAGYTILISPFHKEVVENYYSDRALFEVGNSYARTSGLNSGRRPTLENMPLKHPLHLTRREDVNYSNADAVLPEDHIEYTHMAGSGTVLAMMAKMPAVTAEEAITIFDTLVRHVENTCRFDSSYASFADPTLAARAPTIPDADAFQYALCSTYSLTTAQRRAFGTYFLPAESHSRNIKGVRWEEVYKDIPADFAIVDAPQVTIRSAARHHPLRYGPDPFKPRRKGGSTCTRFVVAAPGFTLLDAEFNQTGCGGLEAAAQTPIRFVGTDARYATVEATALYVADQDAVVGAVVLGGDHSLVFSGGSTAVDGMYLNMSMYGERNGERVGPSEGTFSTYFQLGVADGTGTVRFAPPTCAASAGCANLSTTIIQQLGQNKSETVRYKCADAPGAATDLALYEYPPGGCRVLDVGAITQVFGSGYEAGIYHRDPSTVNHEYAILIGLSLLVLALLLINCGLTISGDKAAHRALGLMGPMPDAALYEALKGAEIESGEGRRQQPRVAASFSHFGAHRRRVVPGPAHSEELSPEWTTVPATARKGTLWQRHAGVGVQVQVGKTIYDAEALLDPAFDLSPLPPTLQSAAIALRKNLMAEHTD